MKVTFFLFCFNQQHLVREACLAALSQDCEPLEIILSDDCSTDSTYEVLQSVLASYAGPHRVLLNRNPENLGLIGHVNRCLSMASGDLIVVAAGDDVSRPDRVSRLVEAFGRQPGVAAIHSSVREIDEHAVRGDILRPPVVERQMSLADMARSEGLYFGATGAWSRTVYERFGTIESADVYEDLVIGFRAALMGELAYVDEPLVDYRTGIGISRRPKVGFASFRTKIRHRKKIFTLMQAVYRQRMIDLGKVPDHPAADSLRNILAEEIADRRWGFAFYEAPWRLLGPLVLGPSRKRVARRVAIESLELLRR